MSFVFLYYIKEFFTYGIIDLFRKLFDSLM